MTNSATDNQLELTTACYARDPVNGRNSLEELPAIGKLNLRGDAANVEFSAAIEDIVGATPPTTAHTLQQGENGNLIWLGPDEWLLYCDIDRIGSLYDGLRDRLGNIHSAVTEVSDYYAVLRLRGPDSEAILRRGCPLDLHRNKFQPGAITQTRFGHASILLHRHSEEESWDIQIRWTYAEYLWDYLVSAMRALEAA